MVLRIWLWQASPHEVIEGPLYSLVQHTPADKQMPRVVLDHLEVVVGFTIVRIEASRARYLIRILGLEGFN